MGVLSWLGREKRAASPWSTFNGKSNDKLTLREKAIALAPVAIELALRQSRSVSGEIEEVAEGPGGLLVEALIVDLHMIDRIAFEQLGAERRNWFMDPLLIEVNHRLAAQIVDETDARIGMHAFGELYSERSRDYAPLSLITEEGRVSNSVGWQLATHLGLGEDQPLARLEVAVRCSAHFVSAVKNLRLRELIGN